MSKFSKGDRVINTETNEQGYIIEVYPPSRGRQLYKVKYDDRETDENSAVLMPDVDLTDPFERCRQNIYGYYTEYLKGNTTFKIQSSNNSTISSLKASRTLFRPYQFKPLLKFLNSDNKRILIADEVGLGKTIEAGHIMLEMKARGEFHNALVICPKSLRAKWTVELNEKFGFKFIEIEDKRGLLNELKHHNGQIQAVVNYDKFREGSEPLKFILEKNITFSVLICDESHRLRNITQNYRGIEQLVGHADSVVFMSATPIMINQNNLYNQLHLLDSEVYDNPEVFENNVLLNRPFVRALSELNSGIPLTEIAKSLAESEVTTTNIINEVFQSRSFSIGEYFKDYPIYQQIMSDLQSGVDTPANRAKIQYNLSEMSPMNSIFSRTRKREVTQDWSQAERNPHTLLVTMTEQEQNAYDQAIEDYKEERSYTDQYGVEHTGALGLVTLKRQLASSIWGYQASASDGRELFTCKEDSKYNELLRILHEVFANGQKKIIVFAVFKKTLRYLNYRLSKDGYKSVMIYGDTSIDKNAELLKFQNDDSVQILLSSEVGSEGLDMQFCNSLVNYDLPWNPMVVEQRIGRIDRFGQESEKINIYNIVVENSILETIYFRLMERIGIFRESIGDLEAILDANMELNGSTISIQDALGSIERDFYSDKLTPQEAARKQNEIVRAIENEKLNLKKIEDGLTNTLTNDSYFRDEINRIINNNAYVTAFELQQLVQQLIIEFLPSCQLLGTDNPNVFEFVQPISDPAILKRFLQNNEPVGEDCHKLFESFINAIDDRLRFKLTFDQEYAFRHKDLVFINIYHPIIRASVRVFEQTRDKSQCTFFFEMPSAQLPGEIANGQYLLGIYKMSVSRTMFGNKMVTTDSLYPVLYNLNTMTIVDDQELAEKFLGRAQVAGCYAPLDHALRIDSEQIDDLRYDFKDVVDKHIRSVRAELVQRIENSQRLRYEQTDQYYNTRIRNLESSISVQEMNLEYAIKTNDDKLARSSEGALRLLRSNLKDIRQRREADLERIKKDKQINIKSEISSLNLVNVI